MDEKLFGGSYLRLAEEGDSIAGLREYREGDPAKRIHWKRSAGQGVLYIKQYEQPLRERVLIVADASSHELEGEEKLIYTDTLCRTAAALCRHSLLRKREASIFAKSARDAQPNRCDAGSSLEPFLKWLALLRFDGSKAGFEEALECALSASDEAASIFVLTRDPTRSSLIYLESISVRVGSVSLVRIEEKKAYDGRLHTLFIKPASALPKTWRGIYELRGHENLRSCGRSACALLLAAALSMAAMDMLGHSAGFGQCALLAAVSLGFIFLFSRRWWILPSFLLLAGLALAAMVFIFRLATIFTAIAGLLRMVPRRLPAVEPYSITAALCLCAWGWSARNGPCFFILPQAVCVLSSAGFGCRGAGLAVELQ
jgi:hypothetical protein